MKLKWESIKNRGKSYLCEFIRKIHILHKMDYDKFPVYLNDNIRLGSCAKEPETITWLESFGKDDVLFDIGANVGAYSLIASRYVKQVYSFEPSVFNFSILVKNIRDNKFDNIVPLNVAASNERKIGTYIYNNLIYGGSGHNFDVCIRTDDLHNADAYRLGVMSYGLDKITEDFNIPKPNHVKIDVDGTEFDILKGMKKILSDEGFKTIMVEAHNEDKELFDYLKGLGFKLEKSRHAGHDVRYNHFFTKIKS